MKNFLKIFITSLILTGASFAAYGAGNSTSGTPNTPYGSSFPSIGLPIGAEYLSSPPTLASGLFSPLQLDVNGNLKTVITSGGITGQTSGSAFSGANGVMDGGYFGGNWYPLQLSAASGGLWVGGGSASGVAVSGNPNLTGGRAENAEPTPVTNGQAVAAAYGLEGKQIILPFSNKENFATGTGVATSSTTAITVISAGAAGLKTYVKSMQCGRTDAGTTSIILTLNDSKSSILIIPAGGGTNPIFEIPIQTAAATAFTFTSGTSVSSVYCNAQGYYGS